MKNSNIMALPLALCNVEQGQAVKVPAMAGSNFHLAIYKTLHLCDFEPFFLIIAIYTIRIILCLTDTYNLHHFFVDVD